MNKDIAIARIRDTSQELVRQINLLTNQFSAVGSMSQWHTLIELNIYKKMNMAHLVERLNLDKSTVSRLVEQLVDKNICTIQIDKDDRRNKLISLTPKGLKLFKKINTEYHHHMQEALICISQQDQATLAQGLFLYTQILNGYRLKAESKIHQIFKQDIAQLKDIYKLAQTEFGSEINFSSTSLARMNLQEISKNLSTGRTGYFVFEHNKEIFGIAGYSPLFATEPNACILSCFYFSIPSRGSGLCYPLMRKILDNARSNGFKQCYAEGYGFMRERSAFYHNIGFKILDNVPDHIKQGSTTQWYIKEL